MRITKNKYPIIEMIKEKTFQLDCTDNLRKIGASICKLLIQERCNIYTLHNSFLENASLAYNKLIENSHSLENEHGLILYHGMAYFYIADAGIIEIAIIECNKIDAFIHYDIIEDNVVITQNKNIENELSEFNNDDIKRVYNVILQGITSVIMFKQFAKIEKITIPSNNKMTIDNEKILNELDLDVTHLDCKWFREICNDNPFWVKGHFRLQLYSNGKKELIYINPFMKNGYHRQALKDKFCEAR